MIRNLKVLGLALVAVLAMSATVASAASAASFTASGGAGTKISAEDIGNIQLKVTGQTTTCGKALFSGTAPAATFTEIKVGAEYNECKTSLGTTVAITGFGQYGEANPCSFNLQSDGKADLNCPAGQEVTVNAATCAVHIPGQQNVGTLTYSNSGSHVNITLGIKNITANHTDGFLCPLTSSGHATGAELVTPAGSPVTAIPSAGALSFDP